ncbi:CLUMA_CG009832, isoform A [Clunio marinus]|uniref:CLUMA_CG009832, isoform A n=1 Tax=Clunio marinus TaxID=568069 RepID=A0A1J1I821_9DIPT|nr:CLUMA_CG009832, isoform A [Clunio marinus]
MFVNQLRMLMMMMMKALFKNIQIIHYENTNHIVLLMSSMMTLTNLYVLTVYLKTTKVLTKLLGID